MLTSTIDQAHYRNVMGTPAHRAGRTVRHHRHRRPPVRPGGRYLPIVIAGSAVGQLQCCPRPPPVGRRVRAAGRPCASVLVAGQESVCRALSSK